jgi:hypothetical protein
MALLQLFTQTKAKIGAVELDCSVQETHERQATLTQSPVEDGSTISDNVVLLPKRLTVEGVVSKTPLGAAGLIGSAISAAAGLAGNAAGGAAAKKGQNAVLAKAAATTGVASIAGLVASGILSKEPADVFKALEELWKNRIPFTVVTAITGGGSSVLGSIAQGLGITDPTAAVYTNMIMTSLNVPRNKDNVNALRFTATMEQVIVVSTAVAILAQIPGASAAQNLGKQATGAASSGTDGSGASLLSQWTGLGA